jgi:hypothetical protein
MGIRRRLRLLTINLKVRLFRHITPTPFAR